MALRSGYYGLKNSVKRTLEKLASDMSGAKIIKTIGDGLSLSAQGSLAASIDTDTMEFKDHKLAAKIPDIPTSYDADLLFDAQGTPETSITLSESLDGYDALMFVMKAASEGAFRTVIVDTDYFIANAPYNSGTLSATIPHLFIPMYYQSYFRLILGDDTDHNSLIMYDRNGAAYLGAVYGLKF